MDELKAAAIVAALLFAGCSGWRATLNPERPGVRWTMTYHDVLDAHAEELFPVAYSACKERKECR